MTAMPARDADNENVVSIKGWIRETLREIEGFRQVLREKLYVLELADDPQFKKQITHMAETLEADKPSDLIAPTEFRKRYEKHLVS